MAKQHQEMLNIHIISGFLKCFIFSHKLHQHQVRCVFPLSTLVGSFEAKLSCTRDCNIHRNMNGIIDSDLAEHQNLNQALWWKSLDDSCDPSTDALTSLISYSTSSLPCAASLLNSQFCIYPKDAERKNQKKSCVFSCNKKTVLIHFA